MWDLLKDIWEGLGNAPPGFSRARMQLVRIGIVAAIIVIPVFLIVRLVLWFFE